MFPLFPDSKLLQLALERFPDLSDLEVALVIRIDAGRPAIFSDVRRARGTAVLRSELLSWLCKTREARDLIPDSGIQIGGAWIEGMLNLQYAQFGRPLVLHDCAMKQGIHLQNAQLKLLSLEGSHVGNEGGIRDAIVADGAKIEGSVFLRRDFEARGEVRLLGVEIGGDLNCVGGNFINENGKTLLADGTNIEGNVLLRNGFEATGEVRLLGSKIGGNLDCVGGKFINENGNALGADNVKVNGGIFLRGGFEARGEVRLLGATIGGDLDCEGGKFTNVDGDALGADGAKIKGSVFLREGFEAQGEVRLLGAEIGCNLDCAGGKFINENSHTLSADGTKIKGSAFLNEGFDARGAVRLPGAAIGCDLDCAGGIFTNEGGVALNAEGAKIERRVALAKRCSFQGLVSFVHSEVRGLLQWHDIANREKATLDLRGVHAHTLWIGETDIPGPNHIYLHGLTYDSIDDAMKTDAGWWIGFIESQAADSPESEEAAKAARILEGLGEKTAAEKRRVLAEKLKIFLPQPYEQAAKILRAHGHDSDAREILVAKEGRRKLALPSPAQSLKNAWTPERNLRRALSEVTEWLWYHWLAPLIGYGHRPSQALWVAVASVLFGWWLFACGDALYLMKPMKPEAQVVVSAPQTAASAPPREFRPFVYALETFTPLIKLREADYWRADDAVRWSRGWWVGAFTVAYTCWGWILTTLLVAALTGLVRK